MKTDEDWGFSYIRNIMASLEVYETNRDFYKNMDEFYPTIIKNLVDENHKFK